MPVVCGIPSIPQPELPQGDGVAGGKLDVVLDDKGVGDAFYLLLAFLAAADFKRMVANPEVGNGGGDDVVVDAHLIEEEGLADIPDFGLLVAEGVYQVGVVEVDLIHLAQAADAAGVVPELGYEPGLLYIEAIVGHAVAAHVERRGDAADIGLEGHALRYNRQQLFQLPPGGDVHAGILGNVNL